MTEPTTGVLDQEHQRKQRWADLGLPDPVIVDAEERTTEQRLGRRWRSPKRAALEAAFTEDPTLRPPWWRD